MSESEMKNPVGRASVYGILRLHFVPLRMREPEALPVAVRKQEFFIRNALIGHCVVTTLFPHFSKKFSVKYFLLASRKVLLVNFSAKRKSNNEKECFADRRSAMKTLFALTRGRSGQNR